MKEHPPEGKVLVKSAKIYKEKRVEPSWVQNLKERRLSHGINHPH